MEKDYLDEDPVINEQLFVCLSFLTHDNIKTDNIKTDNKNKDVMGVKVRGVYSTLEEANNRANKIRNFDPNFNVYVGEVGKWLAFCDNPELAKDGVYANKELNNLMKNYMEEQHLAKENYEMRKKDLMNKAVEENKKKKENNIQHTKIDDEELDNAKKVIQEKEDKLNKLMKEMELLEKELSSK